MPIPVKVKSYKNPQNDTVKYYMTEVSAGYVTLEDVAKQIEKISTVSSADIKAVLDSLQHVVISNLKNCISVRLGDLGSFRATIGSKGVADKASASVDLIKAVRVVFTKSATMTKELAVDNVTFHRVESQQE